MRFHSAQQPLHETLNQATTKLSRISEPLNWHMLLVESSRIGAPSFSLLRILSRISGLKVPIYLRSVKVRCRAQSCKGTLELPSPLLKELTGECAVRRDIQSLQNTLWGSGSEKHDPGSRFLCQIGSSSRSIHGSLAYCTAGVNWKSRSSVQPLSSNVLPTEDDFLDNKFNASASSSYKLDCL